MCSSSYFVISCYFYFSIFFATCLIFVCNTLFPVNFMDIDVEMCCFCWCSSVFCILWTLMTLKCVVDGKQNKLQQELAHGSDLIPIIDVGFTVNKVLFLLFFL
ncbi:hypothetical protein PIB30_000787 [Stylosanthes scabra]|uniref:ATP synthase F0 subunit 8 n=1 Tax=Stylosanthes scabra TaxID=79078 RepID=A0ABU6Q3G1_9FABA|nr:hypothetical protein [Stylosanthes scabra]